MKNMVIRVDTHKKLSILKAQNSEFKTFDALLKYLIQVEALVRGQK